MDLSMTAPHASAALPEAFDHQDEVFARAFIILQEAIERRTFPAASVAVTHRGRLIALKALGRFTYEAGAPPFSRTLREGGGFDFEVVTSTLFDLGSVTKVVATTTMAMLLYERGLLDLDAPVSAIVPEFTNDPAKDPRRHEVTLRMLLAHSSGLPAYEKLFLKARTRDQLLQAAFTLPLATNPAHQRRIQRHRIHRPRRRPRAPRRRIPRPLLPARNLLSASHDQHNLQSPNRTPRANSSNRG